MTKRTHCPSCCTPTRYDLRCAWHYCFICQQGLGDEQIWHKAQTRLGRLWLRVFTT